MNPELKVVIAATTEKLKKGVQDAKKQINTLGQKAKSIGTKIKNAIRDAGDGIGNFVTKGVNIAKRAIAGLGVAFTLVTKGTEEFRRSQAQLSTSFVIAGGTAEQAKETYNGLYRVLGDTGRATEAAQHLAKLTTNQKDLKTWTTICTGVYATFGDSLPIESLTEAANETAKTGILTGALTDALNWAGISEEEFQERLNACNTEAEREQLIRETLNGSYGEAAELYEQNSAALLAQNEAEANLQATLAALGEALAPILTAFTEFATNVLTPLVPIIQDLAEKILPTLKPVLEDIANAIAAVIGWIVDNWQLVSTIATVILAIVAAVAILNAVLTICNTVMLILSLNPIVLAIIAIIAAIILCIVYWDEIAAAAAAAWDWICDAWEGASKWFSGVWDGIKKAFANVGTWFSNIFKGAWNGIKTAWGAVKTWFSNIWTSIKNTFSVVGTWFSNIFKNAWNGIKNAFSSVATFFTGVWTKIKTIFSSVGTAIATAIKSAVSKAVNAVLSVAVGIINGFIGAINLAIGLINLIPGVNISTLKKLEVPKMARGGVVNKATLAEIGENGAEAVVPLENNLEWLDKLAGMLNDRMGGGGTDAKTIVLQVDGKTFAQTSIASLNAYARQTGSLGLALV